MLFILVEIKLLIIKGFQLLISNDMKKFKINNSNILFHIIGVKILLILQLDGSLY